MKPIFRKILNFLGKHSAKLTALGAILAILNYTGFTINIPQFYSSLNVEGKLYFLFFVTLMIVIVFFVFILGQINEIKNRIKKIDKK